MPDTPLLRCYGRSEDAEHAIQRGGELLAARRALMLSVWLPTAALGPLLAFTANTVNLAELDRAATEAGDRLPEEGARIARFWPGGRAGSPPRPADRLEHDRRNGWPL